MEDMKTELSVDKCIIKEIERLKQQSLKTDAKIKWLKEAERYWQADLKELSSHAREVEDLVYKKILDYAQNIQEVEELTKAFRGELCWHYRDLIGMADKIEKRLKERIGEIALKGDVGDTSPVKDYSSIDGKTKL